MNESDGGRQRGQLPQARTGDCPALPPSPAEGLRPCLAGAGGRERAVTSPARATDGRTRAGSASQCCMASTPALGGQEGSCSTGG